MSYDAFVSYSRKDNEQGRVSQFVERLRRQLERLTGRALKLFFDVAEIRGMDDWRERILEGLRQSKLLIACLSPDYCDSRYCEWEVNEFLKHEVARAVVGQGIAPVYLTEIEGWSAPGEEGFPDWIAELRRRQRFDLRAWWGDAATARDAAHVEPFQELIQQLGHRIQRSERAEASLGNVDAHNPHFVGRAKEMRALWNAVGLGRAGLLTVVHGLGGIGKTALAIEYAHAYAHEYGGGRWQVRTVR